MSRIYFQLLSSNGFICPFEYSVLDYDKDAQKLLAEDFQDPEASPGLWEGDIAGFTLDVRMHT